MLEKLLERTNVMLDKTKGWDSSILDDTPIPSPDDDQSVSRQKIDAIISEATTQTTIPIEPGDFLYQAAIYFRLAQVYGDLTYHQKARVSDHVSKFTHKLRSNRDRYEGALLYKLGLTYLRLKLDQPVHKRVGFANEAKKLIGQLNRLGGNYKPSEYILRFSTSDKPSKKSKKTIRS